MSLDSNSSSQWSTVPSAASRKTQQLLTTMTRWKDSWTKRQSCSGNSKEWIGSLRLTLRSTRNSISVSREKDSRIQTCTKAWLVCLTTALIIRTPTPRNRTSTTPSSASNLTTTPWPDLSCTSRGKTCSRRKYNRNKITAMWLEGATVEAGTRGRLINWS